MDEDRLKNLLLQADIPAFDPEARKAALNLALAEFKKIPPRAQGSGFLARLTGMSNLFDRRDPVERIRNKRLVYGGMATAMVALVVAGVSFTQLQNFGQESAVDEVSLAASIETTETAQTAENGLAASQPVSTLQAMPAKAPEVREEDESKYRADSAPVDKSDANERMRTKSGEKEESYAASLPDRNRMAQVMTEQKSKSMEGVANIGDMEMRQIAPIHPEFSPGPYYKDTGRDKFQDFEINPVKITTQEPVSTFSADVDTASYSFVRRQLNHGVLPQKDAVRAEELINYFDYDYALPGTREQPFMPNVAVIDSPWSKGKKLVRIGIKGFDVATREKPRSNLVFLIDTSGSMDDPEKLPLVKASMKMLLESLQPEDTVALAVYAGAAGTVLEPTKVFDKAKIIAALDNLSAGGSTAGAQGLALAYQLAEQNLDKNAVNRVFLATDGDFNVGITNPEELQDFVERKRESGVYLSVLGFGEGNLNDQTMQVLAQNGNGVAAYIDTLNEARKVLVEEASSALFPIAGDVKMQVEFNPGRIAEYRLIGYETRHLNREDFNNDKIDAGDIGAGHTVTALYEITPVGEARSIDDSRYAAPIAAEKSATGFSGEYGFLKIRYKLPGQTESKLISTPILDAKADLDPVQRGDLDFATAVAGFAQILQGGQYTGSFTYDDVIALAKKAKGEDSYGQRAEFVNLVRLAKSAGAMPAQ